MFIRYLALQSPGSAARLLLLELTSIIILSGTGWLSCYLVYYLVISLTVILSYKLASELPTTNGLLLEPELLRLFRQCFSRIKEETASRN